MNGNEARQCADWVALPGLIRNQIEIASKKTSVRIVPAKVPPIKV